MQLAGYIWNDSWLQLSSDPCPIPVSTQPTLLPQANTYISDGQCGQSITVTPNPSNGIFTVDFTNLALNVNTLDIINLSTQGIVFTTNTVSFPMQISIHGFCRYAEIQDCVSLPSFNHHFKINNRGAIV